MNRSHKQSMSELKLRRLNEHIQKLYVELDRPRMRVSDASQSLIRYCKTTTDFLVPSVWGSVTKGEDPYAPKQSDGLCGGCVVV
ncbi:guanine nucleotide-binding protein subunit gamma [Schizopora paradoxa]|uniref:Guanine nucleotide-binding protein subunit gamma n=1 Tax=Schizopora paradoxa TaxID=27342 RepID=A0A0H2RFD0_9AGAM|nr:guanine nucleotide-binding protein subunit gamma [Schizopora paradoxa]